MTIVEQALAINLSHCRVSAEHKHFLKDLAWHAKFDPDSVLSHDDRKRLGRLYWEYRKLLWMKKVPVCDKDGYPFLERDLHSGKTHFTITRIAKMKTASGELAFEANYAHDVSHCLVIEEIEYYFCLASPRVKSVSDTQMRREYRRGVEDRNIGQLRIRL